MMTKDYGCPKEWKWGHEVRPAVVPELHGRQHKFYSSVERWSDGFRLSVGSCVVVANKKHSDEGEIAKILHIILVTDPFYNADKARAIVQWYSRIDGIPARSLTADTFIEEAEREIIEDHRSFSRDISLGTISGMCSILEIPEEMPLKSLTHVDPTYFICRYKLIRKSGKIFDLVPILDNGFSETKSQTPSTRIERKTPQTNPHLRRSMRERSKTVSPIKIVGNRIVKHSSVHKSSVHEPIPETLSSDAENESPNKRRNSDDDISMTPRKRTLINSRSVRRNLNESLNTSELNDSTASDQLNYSIVDVKADSLKVKLRKSENQKQKTPSSPRKRFPEMELKTSPRKTRRETMTQQLSTTRKSILKTPTTKLISAERTPRRSITLSDVIEEIPIEKPMRNLKTPRKSLILSDAVQESPSRRSLRSKTHGTGFYTDLPDDSPEVAKAQKVTKTPSTPKSSGKTPGQMTPSQKMKMLREGVITPTLGNRQTQVNGRKSQMELARDQLHVSAVPKSLPCRENEFKDIQQFLEGRIRDGSGGCMYISGVPGTGKTATVTAVIRTLQSSCQKSKLPPFEYIEINGMRLTEPRQAYVHIYRQMQGRTVPWEQAYNFLDKHFRTGNGKKCKTTVLLVDELDMLCNKRQDVVYNLLDWPANKAAHLVVVTIANTMDLPERLLKGKVTSRLGLTRLTFKPYSFRQLQEIVTHRLAGFNAFNGDALQLVARKVAAISGDARRALDICRRAVEIAEVTQMKGEQEMVLMGHVEKALAEMIANPKVHAIRSCSRMEQIFLQAIIAESLRTGVEETTFLGVYAQFETLSSISGLSASTISRTLEICSRLGAYRLIINQHSRNDIHQKIMLNVSPDDVYYALQEKRM